MWGGGGGVLGSVEVAPALFVVIEHSTSEYIENSHFFGGCMDCVT